MTSTETSSPSASPPVSPAPELRDAGILEPRIYRYNGHERYMTTAGLAGAIIAELFGQHDRPCLLDHHFDSFSTPSFVNKADEETEKDDTQVQKIMGEKAEDVKDENSENSAEEKQDSGEKEAAV